MAHVLEMGAELYHSKASNVQGRLMGSRSLVGSRRHMVLAAHLLSMHGFPSYRRRQIDHARNDLCIQRYPRHGPRD